MNMRASAASKLRKCTHCYILKRQFPSICCWYFRYTLSQKHIFLGFKLHLHVYIQSRQFPFITYDMALLH